MHSFISMHSLSYYFLFALGHNSHSCSKLFDMLPNELRWTTCFNVCIICHSVRISKAGWFWFFILPDSKRVWEWMLSGRVVVLWSTQGKDQVQGQVILLPFCWTLSLSSLSSWFLHVVSVILILCSLFHRLHSQIRPWNWVRQKHEPLLFYKGQVPAMTPDDLNCYDTRSMKIQI